MSLSKPRERVIVASTTLSEAQSWIYNAVASFDNGAATVLFDKPAAATAQFCSLLRTNTNPDAQEYADSRNVAIYCLITDILSDQLCASIEAACPFGDHVIALKAIADHLTDVDPADARRQIKSLVFADYDDAMDFFIVFNNLRRSAAWDDERCIEFFLENDPFDLGQSGHWSFAEWCNSQEKPDYGAATKKLRSILQVRASIGPSPSALAVTMSSSDGAAFHPSDQNVQFNSASLHGDDRLECFVCGKPDHRAFPDCPLWMEHVTKTKAGGNADFGTYEHYREWNYRTPEGRAAHMRFTTRRNRRRGPG
eukprot:TRINITY_DN104_c0_g1_i3.p1 TRINITY_DN104_c0_g1~~TRINITY_DN104_c0_g1_i3.p1  ORF type:complete len:310 (+),score=69.17 TRINITY_DN104_c0_g1_i3:698-1627(+)